LLRKVPNGKWTCWKKCLTSVTQEQCECTMHQLQPYPLQNFHSWDQHITSEKLVTGPVFSTAKSEVSLLLEVLADSYDSQMVILKSFQEIHKTLSQGFQYHSILQWSNILSLWETVIYYKGVIPLTGTATRKLYLLTPLVREETQRCY
jgi:hypothetical protein